MARITGPEAATKEGCHSRMRSLKPSRSGLTPVAIPPCGRRRVSLIRGAGPPIESP
jgi:hypothetical protein